MEHLEFAIIPSLYGGVFLIFIFYACMVYLTKAQPAGQGNAGGQPAEAINVAEGQPAEAGNPQQGQPPAEVNPQPGQPPEQVNPQPGQPLEAGNPQPAQPQEARNAGNAHDQPQAVEPVIFFSVMTVSFNIFQAFFIVPSIKLIPAVSKVWKSDSYFLIAIPFTLLDVFFLLIIYKQRANITPRVVAVIEIGYVREMIELGLWALGLYIQNIIDPECIICIFTLLNCSYFLISFVLFLRHPRALSFLDFTIGINAVILVYFIKLFDSERKLKGYEYALFSLSITTCVSVILFKSHQESVIAGIENSRTIFSILGIYIFTPIRPFFECCRNRGILFKNWVTLYYPVAQNWVCTVAPNWVGIKCNDACNWCCNVAPNWVGIKCNDACNWLCNVAPNNCNGAWIWAVTQFKARFFPGSENPAVTV